MKRSRFLALILVVAVMMMGAGYAYWTQDLAIENTITTGVLEVVFDEPTIKVDEYMDWRDGNESTFEIIDTDSYELELTLEDAYPGAEVEISFDLVNQGTMKANVKGFGIAEGAVNADLVLCKSLIIGGNTITVPENTTLASALNNLNIGIEPEGAAEGNVKTVEMVLQIDPLADNDTLEQDEEDVITFTINAMVHQYNDN